MKPHTLGGLLLQHAVISKEAFVRWLVTEGYTHEEIATIRTLFEQEKNDTIDYKKVI